MVANYLWKKDLFVRPESIIFSAEMCILQTRTYWKAGTSQKWNPLSKLKDRAQRVDKKNGVIRLVIFTPTVMVIKMSKMADFMYFLLDTAKCQFQFGQDI